MLLCFHQGQMKLDKNNKEKEYSKIEEACKTSRIYQKQNKTKQNKTKQNKTKQNNKIK